MATVALQGTIGVGLPGENMVLPARDITMDAAIAAIKGEEAQAIVELSEPHKFRNVSAGLCKTFGFSEKETLCLGTRLLCGPLTSASDMRAAMAAAEMGENGTAIVALYSKNCTPLAIRLEVEAIAGEDDTPRFGLVSFRSFETVLPSVAVQSSKEPAILVTVLSNDRRLIAEANTPFCELMGFSPKALARRTLSLITGPETDERALALAILQAHQGRAPAACAARLYDSDGTVRSYDVVLTAVASLDPAKPFALTGVRIVLRVPAQGPRAPCTGDQLPSGETSDRAVSDAPERHAADCKALVGDGGAAWHGASAPRGRAERNRAAKDDGTWPGEEHDGNPRDRTPSKKAFSPVGGASDGNSGSGSGGVSSSSGFTKLVLPCPSAADRRAAKEMLSVLGSSGLVQRWAWELDSLTLYARLDELLEVDERCREERRDGAELPPSSGMYGRRWMSRLVLAAEARQAEQGRQLPRWRSPSGSPLEAAAAAAHALRMSEESTTAELQVDALRRELADARADLERELLNNYVAKAEISQLTLEAEERDEEGARIAREAAAERGVMLAALGALDGALTASCARERRLYAELEEARAAEAEAWEELDALREALAAPAPGGEHRPPPAAAPAPAPAASAADAGVEFAELPRKVQAEYLSVVQAQGMQLRRSLRLPSSLLFNQLDLAEAFRIVIAPRERDLASPLCWLDDRGGVLWASKAFTQLTGFAGGDALGCQWTSFLCGHDTDPAQVARAHFALDKCVPVALRLTLHHENGSPLQVHALQEPCTLRFGPQPADTLACFLLALDKAASQLPDVAEDAEESQDDAGVRGERSSARMQRRQEETVALAKEAICSISRHLQRSSPPHPAAPAAPARDAKSEPPKAAAAAREGAGGDAEAAADEPAGSCDPGRGGAARAAAAGVGGTGRVPSSFMLLLSPEGAEQVLSSGLLWKLRQEGAIASWVWEGDGKGDGKVFLHVRLTEGCELPPDQATGAAGCGRLALQQPTLLLGRSTHKDSLLLSMAPTTVKWLDSLRQCLLKHTRGAPPAAPRPRAGLTLLEAQAASADARAICSCLEPWTILEVNPAWQALCGFLASEVRGRSLALVMQGAADWTRLQEALQALLADAAPAGRAPGEAPAPRVRRLVVSTSRRDGSVIKCELDLVPVIAPPLSHSPHHLTHLCAIFRVLDE